MPKMSPSLRGPIDESFKHRLSEDEAVDSVFADNGKFFFSIIFFSVIVKQGGDWLVVHFMWKGLLFYF